MYPEKPIRHMMHALGISNVKNGDYLQPNKRYSPYPTSYRNYYQTKQSDTWDTLVKQGYATYVAGEAIWQSYYYVTDAGKDYLKSLGYTWHQK